MSNSNSDSCSRPKWNHSGIGFWFHAELLKSGITGAITYHIIMFHYIYHYYPGSVSFPYPMHLCYCCDATMSGKPDQESNLVVSHPGFAYPGGKPVWESNLVAALVDPALGSAALGLYQSLSATLCLVQPRPKMRALFLKQYIMTVFRTGHVNIS